MKRIAKSSTLFALIVFVLLTCTSCAVGKYNLQRYFDEWESEVDQKTYPIYNSRMIKTDHTLLCVKDFAPGTVMDIYCVYNERIFFFYVTSGENHEWTWNIGSISESGGDFQCHFSENVMQDKSSSGPSYNQLSWSPNLNRPTGGFYLNGKIYLRGLTKSIAYDIEQDSINESPEIPQQMYVCTKENGQLTITENKSGISKTITLDKMAENHPYVQQLVDLESQGISNQKHLMELSKAMFIQDEIYIVLSILDKSGESYAFAFQYDFETEKYTYVTSCHISSTAYLFSFVPVLTS